MNKINELEKIVLSKRADWVFDDNVALIFDAHVRRSIPCYDEVQNLISIVSIDCLEDGSVVYDLGTATGEVISSIYRKNKEKSISFYGIDNSPYMISEAQKKCQQIKQVIFTCTNIESYVYPKPADMIIAAFTLQFLDPVQRLSVVRKIKAALKGNGIFILCEKIISRDCSINQRYICYHERWKSCYFTDAEIRLKKESLTNVMWPQTVKTNLDHLKEAGFRKIFTIFQWCNFYCWIAH